MEERIKLYIFVLLMTLFLFFFFFLIRRSYTFILHLALQIIYQPWQQLTGERIKLWLIHCLLPTELLRGERLDNSIIKLKKKIEQVLLLGILSLVKSTHQHIHTTSFHHMQQPRVFSLERRKEVFTLSHQYFSQGPRRCLRAFRQGKSM